jgi:hypothetical protein
MYCPITPSLLSIVLVGELLVEAVAERDNIGRIRPQSEKTTGLPRSAASNLR